MALGKLSPYFVIVNLYSCTGFLSSCCFCHPVPTFVSYSLNYFTHIIDCIQAVMDSWQRVVFQLGVGQGVNNSL